ncbi:hypothetical protein [Hymenobacter crusticola]|uniref:DUF4440 domain-containing protein n=1 Tax=Hymenobacter crusticola TaxID=1770526 RepID=A0A243WFS0_9BACT|nr:hypothetical protein [Hymenobacter crusticola]OUJ74007.1 hypothetical protein BXP70_09630 [Hymenobacter crusticola]
MLFVTWFTKKAMNMRNKEQSKQLQAALVILLLLLAPCVYAQIPPPNKYNTSSYPEDRKAIELLSRANENTRFNNDDYIAVGPEGRISYGFEEWKKGFEEEGATFKSARPVPGTSILRIYNGDAAVKNFVLDVVFATTKGDFPIKVVRTETYIKQNGKWYFVAGQGTRVLSKEEYDEHMKK